MAKKKRHSIGSPSPPSHFTPRGRRPRFSRAEIASKLTQANDLATEGKLQSEIARTLGVSVMTLHRWRKAPPGPQSEFVAIQEAGQPDRRRGGGDRIAELSSRIHGCADW